MTASVAGRPRESRAPCWPAGLLALLAFAAARSVAQTDGSALSGHVSLGVRSVEVGGALTKFKEDINLDDGVRVFDAGFSYAPDPDDDAPVDRIDLDANGLGGDPFEALDLRVRKYGAYKLELSRRRSDYFYQDVIRPAELASVDAATGGDFHRFDFERIRDQAALDIEVSPATSLSFDLERHTREGDSTTTRNIERDNFQLTKPIDESLEAFNAGVKHSWGEFTLIFEQQARDFENDTELFLPGASVGAAVDDPSALDFFFADQSYDHQSLAHLLRIVGQLTPRLDIQAAWRREDLDLDMDASERAAGTGFDGTAFDETADGTGSVRRDIELQQISLGYALSGRLRLTGSLRRSLLEQHGGLVYANEAGSGLWDVETTGTEAGFEVAASQRLVISAGLSLENRDSAHTSALAATALAGNLQTERGGYFARLAFNGANGLELTMSIEDNDIDDPYTLASPDASQRYKITLRRRWNTGLVLSASSRRSEAENTTSGWTADTTQTDIRVSYDTAELQLSLGFSQIDLGRRVDQLVTGGSRQDLFMIDYDADTSYVDGRARWRLTDRLAIGGSFRLYENDGSFPLKRDDFTGSLEFALTDDYLLRLAYRELDYAEDRFDDYDAELLEAQLEVRW